MARRNRVDIVKQKIEEDPSYVQFMQVLAKTDKKKPKAEDVEELRQILKNAQDEWSKTKDSPNHTSFTRVSHDISKIGGNEVLSNAFFFGFRTPIKDVGHPYDSYKTDSFEPTAVKASHEDEKCCLRYSTDEKGILREWSCEF